MMEDRDEEEIARCLKGLEKVSRMVVNMERRKYAGMTGDIFALISDYLIGALMWDFITYDRIVLLMKVGGIVFTDRNASGIDEFMSDASSGREYGGYRY